MMSSKRKQEERHLQILKNTLQVECNKRCFECDQRGPTYVDVTIGSFVCTTCGGILRGLNPPHRVKSVSMATFTPTEIAFIETRGNEFCKNIYLGKYDSRSQAKPDSKNHAKFKFFMEEKYEKKRWYVPPEEAQKPTNSSVQSTSKSHQNENVKPLSTLLGKSATRVEVSKPPPDKPVKVETFLPDFSTPASSITSNTNPNTSSDGGFADFSNAFSSQGFDAFGDFTSGQQVGSAPASTSSGFSNFPSLIAPISTGTTPQQPAASPSKPIDKYADLGDLFSTDNAGTPDITAMWSGFSTSSSNSSVTNTNSGMPRFSSASTQQSATLLNASHQQTSVFGTAQPPSTLFSNVQQQPTQQQQTALFSAPATSAFGGMAQPSFMNMQPQVTSSFGSMQQQPGMFSAQPQQTMTPFGNAQQTPIGTTSFGANQFNTTTAFGTSPQTMYNPQQSQGFGGGVVAATSVANPFMQPAAPSAVQQPSAANPFMMQQQAQNPFSTQPTATNPFMNNPNPSKNQMPTNPFF